MGEISLIQSKAIEQAAKHHCWGPTNQKKKKKKKKKKKIPQESLRINTGDPGWRLPGDHYGRTRVNGLLLNDSAVFYLAFNQR